MIQDIKRQSGFMGSWDRVAFALNRLDRKLGYTVPVTHHATDVDITVQVYEDGMLSECNHAGAFEGTVTKYAGEDLEYEEWAMECDKCMASQNRDGDWSE